MQLGLVTSLQFATLTDDDILLLEELRKALYCCAACGMDRHHCNLGGFPSAYYKNALVIIKN